MKCLPPSLGFSLTRGGLLYSFLHRLGVLRGGPHDVRRQTLALVIAGWGVLALIAGIERLVGPTPFWFAREATLHVRLLIAIPLFVQAEHILEKRCADSLDEFVGDGFAEDPDAIMTLLRRVERIRDSYLPEFVVLAYAVGYSVFSIVQRTGSVGLVGTPLSAVERSSATYLYYAVVALPLFQLILARLAWHWLLWSHLLWRLSRSRIRLVATHPDLSGGIGILSRPVLGWAIASMGATSVVASAWGQSIVTRGTSVFAFATPAVLNVAFLEAVALGPLFFFIGHLARGRYEGLRRYGALALHYTLGFERRWFASDADAEPIPDMLGSPEIGPLADLATGFGIVDGMRITPFGLREFYVVLVAALIPMAPLVLLELSVQEIVARLGRLLLGGLTEQ